MDWIQQRKNEIKSLRGKIVKSFLGVEMALREDDSPQFEDPHVPCKQFSLLYIYFEDGEVLKLLNYQHDDVFGFYLTSIEPDEPGMVDGIYRLNKLSELQCGRIDRVETRLGSEDDIWQIQLEIKGQKILFVAGEIYERDDVSFDIVMEDESILLFIDPDAADLAKVGL
jgi:hypothetical protein